MLFRVTGDGHQGIGPSGVGRSAISFRLRDPCGRLPKGWRLSSWFPCPSPVTRNGFLTANRSPLPP